MPNRSLPLAGFRPQLAAALALALLMLCTRGQHFATVHALPSASWAVFFLAGALVRTRWLFVLLFALASLLDFGSYALGTISDWCLSPAYWALVPAYGSLWLAGRLYARLYRGQWSDVARLAPVLAVAAFVAYLISGGGYYAFSGHYQPTFAGFLPRIATYYPRALGTLAGYAGVAFAVLALLRLLPAQRLSSQARA
ncbi:cobalamin ABC transporter [Frateuria sp. Soil773]|uniref:hypothetical protein n=1 Tax=Frateuria sp. Soil773 TaxID=1736407 RepID=UPI0006FC4742|nr:hypothetical protein [Frateuria sp. Soil773]KRE88893.1 cobalamin ABC transporter [Frateuria sp. Soil773]